MDFTLNSLVVTCRLSSNPAFLVVVSR